MTKGKVNAQTRYILAVIFFVCFLIAGISCIYLLANGLIWASLLVYYLPSMIVAIVIVIVFMALWQHFKSKKGMF